MLKGFAAGLVGALGAGVGVGVVVDSRVGEREIFVLLRNAPMLNGSGDSVASSSLGNASWLAKSDSGVSVLRFAVCWRVTSPFAFSGAPWAVIGAIIIW